MQVEWKEGLIGLHKGYVNQILVAEIWAREDEISIAVHLPRESRGGRLHAPTGLEYDTLETAKAACEKYAKAVLGKLR